MDQYDYLYAVTWAGVEPEGLGAGVDPRFPVEMVSCGQVAGVVSRVGLDQFRPEKLQAGSADIAWLSEVALRHNAIVDALASRAATLPMRLGTLFQSRDSLLAKLVQCEAEAVEFLERLADRQEWAVKVFLIEDGEAWKARPSMSAQLRQCLGIAAGKRRHALPCGQASPSRRASRRARRHPT